MTEPARAVITSTQHRPPRLASCLSRRFAQTVLLACMLAGGSAHAIDPGFAEGTLSLAGRQQPLTAARIFRSRDLAALGRHADRAPQLRILLSGALVSAALLEEVELKGLIRHARRTGVAAVLITAADDAETGKVGAEVLRLPTEPGAPLFSVVALDARFDTPEFVDQAPPADYRGDAAAACAPALALVDLEARLKAGNFASAHLRVTPALLPQIVDLEARAADPAFFAQFAARLPERRARLRQVVQCTLYPSRACLVLRQTSTSLVMLQREAADAPWRVVD